MKELKGFSECDGHIESILIGCRIVKIFFQTWNAKKLVLIYAAAFFKPTSSDSLNASSLNYLLCFFILITFL